MEIADLAIVVIVAALLGIAAKFLKQPVILAYIGSGFVISYFNLLPIRGETAFRVFSDLGIMFLLFLVGLEINYNSIKLVGRIAAIIGLTQVVFTAIFGFVLARLFDFALLPAAYIALALTFSSTVIVVKLISERKDINSLYGKIAIGALLVQDVFAILLLLALKGIDGGGGIDVFVLTLTLLKGLLLFAIMLILGRQFFPFIFERLASSPELLFLTSLAWVFLVASLVSKIGFSIEIAGFLAGLALANSWENFQIASHIKPLRDFFILIFFVILGSSLVISGIGHLLWPIAIFSLFVIVGNPLIVLIIMGLLGYRRRTGFFVGLSLAQISEFSLILVFAGFQAGHLNQDVVTIITAVGIITIGFSGYLITHADKIFNRLSRLLKIFERRHNREVILPESGFNKPIILIGFHRIGQSIALNLNPQDLLVVESDPAMIEKLKSHGISHIFGDITDSEVLDQTNLENARLVISTSPDFKDNLQLLAEVNAVRRRYDREIKTIFRAEREKEAAILYERGVNYVLLPHLTSGQYLGKTIAVSPTVEVLSALKEKDLDMIRRLAD